MESDPLRYLHFLAPSWAPSQDEAEDVPLPAPDADPADAPPEEKAVAVEPPGAALMADIAARLRLEGWHCDYDWVTYRGHAIDARRVKRRYDVELWLVDPEAGRWELVAEPRRGLFRKLFQQKQDPAEEELLRLHLETVVEATEGVSRVSPWRRVPYEG